MYILVLWNAIDRQCADHSVMTNLSKRNQNPKLFIDKSAFENDVCKLTDIFYSVCYKRIALLAGWVLTKSILTSGLMRIPLYKDIV